MSALFKKKCLIPSKRVCLRLKQARLDAEFSLGQLEKKTRIPKKHLQAIEECRFEELKASEVYQKNFIKKYVSALGIDPTPFLEQFKQEELSHKKNCDKHPGVGCEKKHFSDLPNLLRYFLVGGALCLVFLYLGTHIQNILQPPELTLVSPTDGEITYEQQINISGKTDPETAITVNNEIIKNDEKGVFTQSINLTPGINTLIIKAQNKHGKTTEQICHVIYKEREVFSLK
ncbi:hypothetical protein C0581_04620 [Candidatus Parcubacteria bacterium]|nr:MAG: hypothetical protein C0581_04620 [Candidatus Parcubacteria bacterium]